MGTVIDINQLPAINVAGARAWTASREDWYTGGYACLITGFKAEQGDRCVSLVLELQVQTGKLAATPENANRDVAKLTGKTKREWVTWPGTAKDPAKEEHYRGMMRGFLESLGVTAAYLDVNGIPAGQLTQIIQGKTVYLWNIEGTSTTLGDTSWLTPEEYQAFFEGRASYKTTGKLRTDGKDGKGAGTGSTQMPTIREVSTNPALAQALAAQTAGAAIPNANTPAPAGAFPAFGGVQAPQNGAPVVAAPAAATSLAAMFAR